MKAFLLFIGITMGAAVHLSNAANLTLYQTSFEAPAFMPDLPIRGQDNWEMYHDGEAISVSTNNAHTGAQCLRFDGALLEQFGPNAVTTYCFSRALDPLTNNPPAIVEITASLRLDGPQTGTNGTPDEDILSANLMAVVPQGNASAELLGGFFVSSSGNIWSYSRVAADNYKYSVPYTFGTYRTLTLRVDFIARQMTWIVDGITLGSGSFLSSIGADRLVSGYLYLSGPLEPINTPELTYDRTNYVAYFDDYSLASVPVEGAAIRVEQPAGARLQKGAAIVDFGNSLIGVGLERVFTLRNIGSDDLTGVAVAIDGANAGDFTLSVLPQTTVAPGSNTTFTVRFLPTAESVRTAVLHITGSDSNASPFDVTLTGNGLTPGQIVQQAYLKASNTESSDNFGAAVAIDGDTAVIGAYNEASNATGINGSQVNNSAMHAGAAYVFVRQGTNWNQQAYLKASNAGNNDQFGWSVAISENTIVVGAIGEASNATGVNGNQANNSAANSGAAYVFVRSGTNWTQQAYLKASNTDAEDNFAYSVAVSDDTIVVGAPYEASNAKGVNSNQADNSASTSGAAYVFARDGTNWIQQAYLKASNSKADAWFGAKLSVSGHTVIVGALGEDSNATGVNGSQANENAVDSGAAYVFVRSGTNWTQQAYLKASNTGAGDFFGFAAAMSGDTVVIGAPYESSNASGVNGNQTSNSAINSGAVYVFVREGNNWTQQAYLKASNTGGLLNTPTLFLPGDHFGATVAISGDTIVVAAPYEASNATGINGNQNSRVGQGYGAAYVFVRTGTTWSQRAYLKSSNLQTGDWFSGWDETFGVSVSGDTVLVGALGEASNATGVNGNQANNSSPGAGAAYAFTGFGAQMPAFVPRILFLSHETDGTTRLSVNAMTGRNYTLQASETLTNWTDLATQSAMANRVDFTNAPAGSPAQQFYRIKQN